MKRFWGFLHFYMQDRVLFGYNRRESFKKAWRSSAPVDLLYSCDCTPHDITTPGAAHAVDCPRYD